MCVCVGQGAPEQATQAGQRAGEQVAAHRQAPRHARGRGAAAGGAPDRARAGAGRGGGGDAARRR